MFFSWCGQFLQASSLVEYLFRCSTLFKCIIIYWWTGMETTPSTLVKKPLKAADRSFCLRPGRSLTVDVWSPSLRGLSGRLISNLQPPRSTGSCLSFFYKLYGPNAGRKKRAAKWIDSQETRTFSQNFYKIKSNLKPFCLVTSTV